MVQKKQAVVAILDFKVKVIRRNKEGYCIFIKGTIKYEDFTIMKIYAPNSGALNFIHTIFQNLKA